MGFSQGIMPNKTSFVTGQATVTNAVTEPIAAVRLSTESIPIPDGCWLTIIAKPGNGAGIIYLGDTEPHARAAATRFDGIEAGLAVALKVADANLVWVFSDTDGIGVSYIAEQ